MDRTMIMALTATVLSIELMLVLAFIYGHLPVAVDTGFVHTILWHFQVAFTPQRNLFLYELWIFLAVALFGVLCLLMKLTKEYSKEDRIFFLIIHTAVVCFMGHASLEIAALGNPIWAWPVFWGAFALGITSTLFWSEITLILKNLESVWKINSCWGISLGSLFIFLVIFMPDLKAVVAMEYLGNYFRNWDLELGSIYAIAHGAKPCVDVYMTYGFGLWVIIAKIMNALGGFDYAKVLAV